jgi:hypothetical protein
MSGFVRFDEGLNMDAQINTFGNWEVIDENALGLRTPLPVSDEKADRGQ